MHALKSEQLQLHAHWIEWAPGVLGATGIGQTVVELPDD